MLTRLLRLNALSLRERELIVDTFVKNKESNDVLIGFLAAHVISKKPVKGQGGQEGRLKCDVVQNDN